MMKYTVGMGIGAILMLGLIALGCGGRENDTTPAGDEGKRQETPQAERTSRLDYTFIADTEGNYVYGGAQKERRFSRIVFNPPPGEQIYRLDFDTKELVECYLQSLVAEHNGKYVEIPIPSPCRVFPGLKVPTRDCGALMIIKTNGVYELHGTIQQQKMIDQMVSANAP